MCMLTFFKNRAKLSFFALLSTAGLTWTIEGTNTCTFKYRICCSSPTQPTLSPGLPAHRAYQGQETWSGQLWNKCVMEEISSSFPVLEFHLCPKKSNTRFCGGFALVFFSCVVFKYSWSWSGIIREIGCSVWTYLPYIKKFSVESLGLNRVDLIQLNLSLNNPFCFT